MPRKKKYFSEPTLAELINGVPVASISKIIRQSDPYHRPGTVWRSQTTEAEILRGSLNIISVRDRKESIAHGLNLGREICQSELREKNPWPFNPEEVTARQKVFYINCLAGERAIANDIMGLWPGAQDWAARRDRMLRPDPAAHDEMHVYTAPAGQFIEHLPEIQRQQRAAMAPIIILNSFDFACRTARHRDDLVFALLAFRDAGCTVIVFTQEERRKIEKQSRGPLALLRLQADQLFDATIFSPVEYAEPIGSQYADEYAYYEATGQTGSEYIRQLDELVAQRDAEEARRREGRVEVPGRVYAQEIHDSVKDDIEVPCDFVDGGVYNMDGDLVTTAPRLTGPSRNSYTIMRNHFEPVVK